MKLFANQNPAAALASSSAFDSSRFKLRFTTRMLANRAAPVNFLFGQAADRGDPCSAILMKQPELIFFETADELARAAAKAWLDEMENAPRAESKFCVALSGGRITQKFFSATVDFAKARGTSFDGVHFFWADERCVPPADAGSNYRMARELLLEPLKISSAQIHRIRGEELPATAAELAEAELRAMAPSPQNGLPVLDLIFLGLGEDGHTASLFPGEPESLVNSRAVYRAVAHSPKPPPDRVTLGYGTITAAKKIWMLASGSGKEDALRESLSANGCTPFGRILQTRSDIKIFCDLRL